MQWGFADSLGLFGGDRLGVRVDEIHVLPSPTSALVLVRHSCLVIHAVHHAQCHSQITTSRQALTHVRHLTKTDNSPDAPTLRGGPSSWVARIRVQSADRRYVSRYNIVTSSRYNVLTSSNPFALHDAISARYEAFALTLSSTIKSTRH